MSLYRPTIITHPTVEPLTVDESVYHLGLLGTPDNEVPQRDAKLAGHIRAAREYCEARTSRAFYLQTLRIGVQDWPGEYIELPRATPLVSIASVTYRYWSDGTVNTLDPTLYYGDTNAVPGRFVWMGRLGVPFASVLSASEPIQITYVAGADPNASPVPVFPEMLKVAMQMLIADWWMNREAEFVSNPAAVASAPVAFGVDNILDRFMVEGAY